MKFVIFVRPSVRTEQLGSRSTDFHESLAFENFFEYLSREIKFH
jgi:hypothetical protein